MILDQIQTFEGLQFVKKFGAEGINVSSKMLTDYLIKEYPNFDGKVMDMCSGIGTIGITLMNEWPKSQMTFVDINKKNIDSVDKTLLKFYTHPFTRTEGFVSDGLEELPIKKYDLIVGNPPHFSKADSFLGRWDIASNDFDLFFHNVFYETVSDYLNPGAKVIFIENNRDGDRQEILDKIRHVGLKVKEISLNHPYFYLTEVSL